MDDRTQAAADQQACHLVAQSRALSKRQPGHHGYQPQDCAGNPASMPERAEVLELRLGDILPDFEVTVNDVCVPISGLTLAQRHIDAVDLLQREHPGGYSSNLSFLICAPSEQEA